MIIFTWKCYLHGVEGPLEGPSLKEHQDEFHSGNDITVMMIPEETDED